MVAHRFYRQRSDCFAHSMTFRASAILVASDANLNADEILEESDCLLDRSVDPMRVRRSPILEPVLDSLLLDVRSIHLPTPHSAMMARTKSDANKESFKAILFIFIFI
jgi:hypothetical protein